MSGHWLRFVQNVPGRNINADHQQDITMLGFQTVELFQVVSTCPSAASTARSKVYVSVYARLPQPAAH